MSTLITSRYQATPPTLGDGESAPPLLDDRGRLIVSTAGALPDPTNPTGNPSAFLAAETVDCAVHTGPCWLLSLVTSNEAV